MWFPQRCVWFPRCFGFPLGCFGFPPIYDRELAVEVRQGPLRSRAECWLLSLSLLLWSLLSLSLSVLLVVVVLVVVVVRPRCSLNKKRWRGARGDGAAPPPEVNTLNQLQP